VIERGAIEYTLKKLGVELYKTDPYREDIEAFGEPSKPRK
jgi:hypothetical protein